MKRFLAIFLTTVMMLCSFSASVFATEVEANVENTSTATATSYVIDIPPYMSNSGVIPITVNSITLVDNTWTFTNHHQGSNRSYGCTSIGFKVQITDSNGNAVSDRISIQLHDTVNGGTQYYTAYANGNLYYHNNISIIANRAYYFSYKNLSSSSRNIKIHMIIYK